MSKRDKLSAPVIEAFVAGHAGWEHKDGAIAKTFEFSDYAGGIAFVVHVGFAADKRDHHPDLAVGYRKVEARWSTHDAGGVTGIDVEMAEHCDRLHHT